MVVKLTLNTPDQNNLVAQLLGKEFGSVSFEGVVQDEEEAREFGAQCFKLHKWFWDGMTEGMEELKDESA